MEKPFVQFISLWVVCHGPMKLHPLILNDCRPQLRSTPSTPIIGSNLQVYQTRSPKPIQTPGPTLQLCGCQRHNLWPLHGSVHHGKKMCKATRGRNKTHQFHIYVVKLSPQNVKQLQKCKCAPWCARKPCGLQPLPWCPWRPSKTNFAITNLT